MKRFGFSASCAITAGWSSMGDQSPLALALPAIVLSLLHLGLSSFRFTILFGSSVLNYIHDYRFPLFTFP